MSNVVKLKQTDDVFDEASEWIAKLDRGLATSEKRSLQQWMNADERNESTLLQMAKLWDKMDALSKLSEICPEPPVAAEPNRAVAIAASIVFACLLTFAGAYQFLGNSDFADTHVVLSEKVLRTKVGESLTETLPDGSVLALNTDSRVKITYTEKQRVLELQYGELHIDVAHNTEQPLSVYAGGKVIQAVGTAFNVQFYNDEVELLVTEGKVLVAEQDESRSNPIQPEEVKLPASSLSLIQGEKSFLSAPIQAVVKIAQIDMDADLSWQKGSLIFRGESLETAMLEVSRYTAVRFEIPDSELQQVQIAGVFKTDDLDSLLAALDKNFNIQYDKQGSNKVILKKRS